MLTADVLDRLCPWGQPLLEAVHGVTDIPVHSIDLTDRILDWLVSVREAEMYGPRDIPAWKTHQGHPDYAPHADLWSIQPGPLVYKDPSHYLTAEGWPLGTRCWYVRVECGSHHFASADANLRHGRHLALARAVVLVEALRRQRVVSPVRRARLDDYMVRIMQLEDLAHA